MNIIYLPKIFNRCFICTGNGSIKFIESQWMQLCYAWRFALTTVILINVYNGNKWVCN